MCEARGATTRDVFKHKYLPQQMHVYSTTTLPAHSLN